MASSLSGFAKVVRFFTLKDNIGKCPSCGKIQFADEIPDLMNLDSGKWKNVLWDCTKCKTTMESAGVIVIPPKD